MSAFKTFFVDGGKVVLAGLAYAAGTVLAGLLMAAVGLRMPALPAAPGPGQGLLLVFLGGLAMGAGLALLARGLAGTWWQRWAIVSLFVLLVNGVGTALETRIFTTLGGEGVFFLGNAVSGLALALAVCLLFGSAPGSGPASGVAARLKAFAGRWLAPRHLWRFALALLAFPVFYLLFGMIIAPLVVPHYEQLDFLVIPAMPTLLAVLFTRSGLFLVASLAVIAAWGASRRRLVVALGLAHFVTVGLVGLIMTTFLPALLRWVHGIEILADSMFYAWVLVWLFLPRSAEAGVEIPVRGRESGGGETVVARPV